MRTSILPIALVAGIVLATCAPFSYGYDPAPNPPPLLVEETGPPPGPGYVWYPGYWYWIGDAYAWVPGAWDLPTAPSPNVGSYDAYATRPYPDAWYYNRAYGWYLPHGGSVHHGRHGGYIAPNAGHHGNHGGAGSDHVTPHHGGRHQIAPHRGGRLHGGGSHHGGSRHGGGGSHHRGGGSHGGHRR